VTLPILVTGAAGFIGYYVSAALLQRGVTVVGLDNVNPYYDPRLKEARLELLHRFPQFRFLRLDLADRGAVEAQLAQQPLDGIIHLAAQAGVRYSLENPQAYVDSNITGFLGLLELARHRPVRHFVYASSSSVYGANTELPFSTADRVDRPVSLYAASKRANELMAYVYARTFGTVLTGLRFFTVYGPWGRPDMAAMKFARAILAGEPIDVYNHGDLMRDFTFIDDIVAGVIAIYDRPPAPDADAIPHRVYNIGNHRPEHLMKFIELLSSTLGRRADMRMLPMQPGDVKATFADTSELERDYGWRSTTPIEVGLPKFVGWYREFYGV
jgi:UDP-glucuronate 4-epimerase